MSFPNFQNVDVNIMTFKDIFSLYDTQFDTVRSFLLKLGDKFIVEDFTGSTDPVITLSREYTIGKGMLFVFLNGSVQWLDEDFIESSTSTVTLLFDRGITDDVRVVVINSTILNGNIEEYITTLEGMIATASEDIITASSLLNQLNLLSSTIDSKSAAFVETTLDINDIVASIVAYHTEVRDMKAAIEGMSLLTPEEISGTEVPIAREGFASLGTRMKYYSYYLNTVAEMQSCVQLMDGDTCNIISDSSMGDGTQGIYKVTELIGSASIATKTFYLLQSAPVTIGNKVYAYRVGKFGSPV